MTRRAPPAGLPSPACAAGPPGLPLAGGGFRSDALDDTDGTPAYRSAGLAPTADPGGEVASNGLVFRGDWRRSPRCPRFMSVHSEPWRMPQVHLDEETVERLDALREDDESYDELVSELINIYEASEMTMFHSGDAY